MEVGHDWGSRGGGRFSAVFGGPRSGLWLNKRKWTFRLLGLRWPRTEAVTVKAMASEAVKMVRQDLGRLVWVLWGLRNNPRSCSKFCPFWTNLRLQQSFWCGSFWLQVVDEVLKMNFFCCWGWNWNSGPFYWSATVLSALDCCSSALRAKTITTSTKKGNSAPKGGQPC